MRRARLLAICLTAALATGSAAAASALAAPPEFVHLAAPLTLTGFTGKSVGVATIADTTTGAIYKCSSETLEGEIEFGSRKHVEEVVIKFKGCSGEVEKTGKIEKKCSIKSPGQPAGTLKTKRLDGNLISVAPAEAPDEVGLDLLPEIGTVVMIIEAPGCALPAAVIEGSIIGEVAPTGPPETTTKTLLSTTLGTAQKIQHLPSGAKDTLSAALAEVTLKSTVTLKFGEVMEVT